MRRIFIVTVIVFFCFPLSAGAMALSGSLKQGGMAIGKVSPGETVFLDDKPVRVSPEGVFVVGFSRDAKPKAVITVHHSSGEIEKHPISIEQRTYKIQRINGLPQQKVTPSEKDLVRIRKDIQLVKKARKRDDERLEFTQTFIWPITGRISGVYGSQRILNGKPRSPHYGVDIAAPEGTPVKAPIDGVVSMVHNDMFYSGGTLILDHGHGISTVYIHLSKILVKKGQHVHQGDIIAKVGATGRATGPHLHWGMNWFETRLDPSLVVPPMPTPASAKKKE